jgi:demethylmenaquinone methyltransferase/2-methoxy-6-polyprenyl-1,4-benzoquinol methylase
MNLPHQGAVQRAIALMDLQASDHVLELGCGDGWACRVMADRTPKGMVIGLDPSNDAVREARAKSTAYENLLFLWSDPEQIPWQEDFFTRVACLGSVEMLRDARKAFREAGRVLVPGGTLWLLCPTSARDRGKTNGRADGAPDEVPKMSATEYRRLLQDLGYEHYADHSQQLTEGSPLIGDFLLLSVRKPER